MKTLKIKQFETKISQIVEEQKNKIIQEADNHLMTFKSLTLELFSYDKPYIGEFKNKIFLTYCDHYHANSGIHLQIGQLTHPNINMDDRGYIKGVATDLDSYLKLRSAKNLGHNLISVANIYLPRFQKSKHQLKYTEYCITVIKSANDVLNIVVKEQFDRLNKELHNITGCSLLYYISNI